MTGRTLRFTLAGVTSLTLTLTAQVADRPEVQLQAAIKQELVDGDLTAAIERYKALATNANASVAARALVRLAACFDKLGNPEARATYERVIREYPNQAEAVAEAREWLNAHGERPAARAGHSIEMIGQGLDGSLHGRLSPDGRYLAFAPSPSRTGGLGIRDLKTGETRWLIQSGSISDPVPSPDGSQIAFRTADTIRLIGLDGKNSRVLRPWTRGYLEAWSPNGKYLAATRGNSDESAAILLISTTDGSEIQLRSTRPNIFGKIGGFSPDGRYLLYALNAQPEMSDGGVFALAVDGSREFPLVNGQADFDRPTWSPDGGRVFFPSDRSGVDDLWSIQVVEGQSQGTPQLVHANTGFIDVLGMTRDGSLYYGRRDAQFEAYIADFTPETLRVGTPVLVTNRGVGSNQNPEVSPDGTSIAFVRRRSPAPSPWDVVVRSLATGEEHAVTTGDGNMYIGQVLQWFSDGRSLLVNDATGTPNGGRKRFRRVDVPSGDVRTIFEGPWSVSIGVLSPDGTSLYYSIGEDSSTRLVMRRLDSSEETEIYRYVDPQGRAGTFFGLTVSRDGTRLAFSLNTPQNGRVLMTLPAKGGQPRELLRTTVFDLALQGAMAWTHDGRHLIFSGKCGPGDDFHLCAIPVEGGDVRSLGVGMQRIDSRMISADGRRIAFTGESSRLQLWVMRNLLAGPPR